ncbi:hypothetical protein LNQ03_31595 [Klebsiella pneumoniae subsp. pneumoniae]|nr:hypothetical protein [Klebsiella pneumoniae subsp. pneumoniae]
MTHACAIGYVPQKLHLDATLSLTVTPLPAFAPGQPGKDDILPALKRVQAGHLTRCADAKALRRRNAARTAGPRPAQPSAAAGAG